MWELPLEYWPHILAAISLLMAAVAIVHVVMTKDDVRAATGWVGVVLLSPILGPLVYAAVGINRIRRASIVSDRLRLGRPARHPVQAEVSVAAVEARFGERLAAMKILGDRVAHHPLTSGNAIRMLRDGDETYARMIQAIDQARRSVILETYIFDRDPIGLRVAAALIAAVRRGISVRVLIDSIGARYTVPSIFGELHRGSVPVQLFNGRLISGLRLPYANLRTHRKILVVDGAVAFVGGMNIRQGFTREFAGDHRARDTHFCITGPVVPHLFSVAAEDWRFTAGEMLDGEEWLGDPAPVVEPGTPVLVRPVASGPDASLETNHKMLMGAFSTARRSIRIMSPYFLPDRELVSALATAARRGVAVDIIVPAQNNLTLVDRAMTAQFDQVLKHYCRVWRAQGPFDHSKLMTIDGLWAYVGSSNLDPRSLRLNFEIDIEVFDGEFAAAIDERIAIAMKDALPVTLEDLRARPFYTRLINRLLWLGSPYL